MRFLQTIIESENGSQKSEDQNFEMEDNFLLSSVFCLRANNFKLIARHTNLATYKEYGLLNHFKHNIMKFTILIVCFLYSAVLFAQITFTGTVRDQKEVPLVGANVYIKGSYDGTITDSLGQFSFKTKIADTASLIISHIGYKLYISEIIAKNPPHTLTIKLKQEVDEMDAVVITAGTFEAGDKKRAVLLSSLDIATTSSAEGDVFGALATFPGAQRNAESGKIVVRGGDTHESNTYMDGMLVSSPYFSTTPDMPSRGRFTPFMFKGVMFSTGGYSAEYGQALSSVLELTTPGLFDENITSISLMNLGGGLGITRRKLRSAYSIEANYNNLYPFFAMAKTDLNWFKAPQSVGANLYHRIKIGKTGMLKTDITYSSGSSVLDYSNFSNEYEKIGLKNSNLFYKSNYNTELGEKWILKTGYAFNRNVDNIDIDQHKVNENLSSQHAKISLVNYSTNYITLKTGTELFIIDYHLKYTDYEMDTAFPFALRDNLAAGYMEGDIKINKKAALRLGLRGEYSGLTKEANLAPRISFAYKIAEGSQVSMAWGKYYQQVGLAYLKYNSKLEYAHADHFILNYQWIKSNRIFRIEGYYKNYKHLVTYSPGMYAEYEHISNDGTGYARGIDIFYKDNKTIPYGQYWISYSYIDSKRKYKDYSMRVTPDYITNHNFSFIFKYWIEAIQTQAGLTYNYSSGRYYNNPNNEAFMEDKTAPWHDLSGNMSYITRIFKQFTVVYFSASNILGLENIYTYRFPVNPDETGYYKPTAVKSMMYRSFILGLFISIK